MVPSVSEVETAREDPSSFVANKLLSTSCPPDVHMALENDIARFLNVEKAIIYSQGFSTISSVIPAFSKRGDIIVADKGVNFAIQKGIQVSRSTVRYYEHNDMNSLESTLKAVVQQYKRKRPLTRRFIITEGVFENDGQIANLKRLLELKRKYKFRLILDESLSFGTLGKQGRGMTELFDVPATEVDMIVGSMANTLGGAGGFCAGTSEVVFHQRINGPSYVYSAALPAMLAVAASIAINKVLTNDDDVLGRLRENVKTIRAGLDQVESLNIPSAAESPVIHLQVRSKTDRHPLTAADKFEKQQSQQDAGSASTSLTMGESREKAWDPHHDLVPSQQLALLTQVVDDALEHGLWVILRKRLPSIKPDALERGPAVRPSIRLSVSAGLTKKECEKAAAILKASAVKVLGKRRL